MVQGRQYFGLFLGSDILLFRKKTTLSTFHVIGGGMLPHNAVNVEESVVNDKFENEIRELAIPGNKLLLCP